MDALHLDQLRTLVAVVDLGSFDAAATYLHLTQSAVSQRIRALEDSAGRILVRRDRPVTATDISKTLRIAVPCVAL
jgi:LysR family transcriptional regulator (chromosome initiation inhibitor)